MSSMIMIKQTVLPNEKLITAIFIDNNYKDDKHSAFLILLVKF